MAHQLTGKHCVVELDGGGSELITDLIRSVLFAIVIVSLTSDLQSDSLTQHDIRPVIVDELLVDGNVDGSCDGEQSIVAPLWIHTLQFLRNLIVRSEEDRVKAGDEWIGVDA